MTVDVASLALRVDALEVKDAEQSLKRMQKAGADAESGLQGSTEAIVGQFKKVAGIAAAAYAAVQTLGGASSDFLAFDKTLGEISTQLLDATGRVKEFANESVNLALSFGSGLTDQSKAFYEVLSTGITKTREATELLTAANKLAIGGNSNLGTAISGLTSIVKGYGDKVKDVNEVSDTLFTASLAGKISIEELSEGLGRIIPLADALDVGLEEVTASIAALTLTGVSARESITSVRAVLAAVVKPSSEAADEAERLGLNFSAAAIKSKGMLAFLEDLKQKTGGSVASLGLLFGGVESILPALNLTNNAGREFNQIMGQMADKAGITDKAFDQMAATADFKVNRFFAAMNVISKEVGATLASILTPAAEGAANALSRLFKTQNLSDIEQQQKKINDLTESLEKMRGRNAVIPFADNFIYSKKDLDEAESRIDQAKADLQDLIKAKEEAAKPITAAEEQKLTPNDPPKVGATATKEKQAAITESERFLKALKEESMQVGVTGIALIELKAGYLGVADAAAPYIQKMKESEAALTAQKDLNAQYARDMEKVKQITLEVASAEDTFIAKQNELNRLLGTGQLGPDTYFKALEKAGDDMRKTVQGGNQDFEQLKFAVQGWGRAATDTLVDFAISGKGSFSDFATSVIKDIARMYIQMKLITPLLQSLPGLSFGGGGAASATTTAASSVFSNLFKGFRASGGSTSPNSLYQVNELGTPELFASGGKQFLLTGNQSGQVTPTQVGRAGGGMGNVVVNLVEAPGKGGQVSQKQTASGMEIDVMVDQLVAKKTKEQGSATNKSLRQNFGMSDNLVMR